MVQRDDYRGGTASAFAIREGVGSGGKDEKETKAQEEVKQEGGYSGHIAFYYGRYVQCNVNGSGGCSNSGDDDSGSGGCGGARAREAAADGAV
ncbi:hypothetical protein TWF191_008992 [Orbilia oligospora]|uniref:Uncharacterized protein n=1 Tax=Orbilia oligospora TaxID=2813651 RepID=A0A7C8QN03_ORBOL|nr:hypothetical protein TWF191_008992 [Orbilia oligospora]